jgi:hypothetical protein
MCNRLKKTQCASELNVVTIWEECEINAPMYFFTRVFPTFFITILTLTRLKWSPLFKTSCFLLLTSSFNYKIIIVHINSLSNKLPESGRKYKFKSWIGKHPNRPKRKLRLPKVYLSSDINTKMQCGKVISWNKICRLAAQSVAIITPWYYLVSGLFPAL